MAGDETTNETTSETREDDKALNARSWPAPVRWPAPAPLAPGDYDLIREARRSPWLTLNTIAMVLALRSPRAVVTAVGSVVTAVAGGALGRHLLG